MDTQQLGLDRMLFSGGVNGSIHLWRVPTIAEAQPYGPVVENNYCVATWE